MSAHHVSARTRTRLIPVLVTALVAALAALGAGPAPAANAADPTLSLVGSSSAFGNRTSHSVTLPTGIQNGDTIVLFLTVNSLSGTLTGPAGWTLLQTKDGSATRGRVWTKQAVGNESGTVVTVAGDPASTIKDNMSVAVYRSSAGTSSVTASAGTAGTTSSTSHTTPSVAVAQAGSWLVSSWSEKSSTAQTWTPPASATQRQAPTGAGSGKVSSLLADSNGAVPTGTAAGRTATTSAAGGGEQLFSVVVSPGTGTVTPPTNTAPVASFTVSCVGLTCGFDASGSSDANNDPLTYAWQFGDGTTSTAGPTTSRTYASAATRTVTLTVSDGALTNSTTRSATTSSTPRLPVPGHTKLVPETAHTDMPKIANGEIFDIKVVGSRVFIAGTFTTIQNQRSGNTTTYTRNGLASYNLTTGLVDTGFNPKIAGGNVETMAFTPDNTKLFITGSFSSVNGTTKRGIASLNLDHRCSPRRLHRQPRRSWLRGRRHQLHALHRRQVHQGQQRRPRGSGSGQRHHRRPRHRLRQQPQRRPRRRRCDHGPATADHPRPEQAASSCTPARQVAGQDRYGVAMISIATKQLLPWRTRLWEDNLQFVGGIQRAYAGDISPDDSYFVVTSGSGGDRPPINDTAMAFPVDAAGDHSDVQTKWITRCFDSIYSVAISEKAVYIGGHFAWNESPTAPDPWPGLDDVGYGTGQGLSGYGLGDAVVNREHLGALNPVDGKALEWNPGSNSYEGNKAMEVTPRGLFTGGDATTQAGSNIGRIAFFDFNSVAGQQRGRDHDHRADRGPREPGRRGVAVTGTASVTSGTINRVELRGPRPRRQAATSPTTGPRGDAQQHDQRDPAEHAERARPTGRCR